MKRKIQDVHLDLKKTRDHLAALKWELRDHPETIHKTMQKYNLLSVLSKPNERKLTRLFIQVKDHQDSISTGAGTNEVTLTKWICILIWEQKEFRFEASRWTGGGWETDLPQFDPEEDPVENPLEDLEWDSEQDDQKEQEYVWKWLNKRCKNEAEAIAAYCFYQYVYH